MKQLVTITFNINNTEEEKRLISKITSIYFTKSESEIYNLLNAAYDKNIDCFTAVDFILSFKDNSTEEDMFDVLETIFSCISFTCKINNKNFKHNTTVVNSKINTSIDIYEAINFNTVVNVTLKEGYTIIRTEELEKLKRFKDALKGLCGISRALENKLKTLSNDIRTISES